MTLKGRTYLITGYVSWKKTRQVLLIILLFLFLEAFIHYDEKIIMREEDLYHRKSDHREQLLKPYFSRDPYFRSPRNDISVITSSFSSLSWHNVTGFLEGAQESDSQGVTGTDQYSIRFTGHSQFKHEDILRKLIPFHRSLDVEDQILRTLSTDNDRHWSNEAHKLKLTSPLSGKNPTFSARLENAISHNPYGSKWTRITDNLFIYSTYWENRNSVSNAPFSRTLAIIKYDETLAIKQNNFKLTGQLLPTAVNVSCYLWVMGKKDPVIGKLEISFFEEGRYEYIGVFLKCRPIELATQVMTTFASHTQIVSGNGEINERRQKPNVQGTEKSNRYYAVSFIPFEKYSYPHKLNYFEKDSFHSSHSTKDERSAVCIRPLYGPYNETSKLLQFVIYHHEVLKVDTFFFYDLSINLQVRKLLKHLREFGIAIEVLSWNLPTGEWNELWDYGSLTAINDCVYRAMFSHEFVVIVDIDEFIVPKKTPNRVLDIYNTVITQTTGQFGDAVLLPNAFFCSEFKGNVIPKGKLKTGSLSDSLKLPIFNQMVREGRAWPKSQRSKLIITPSSVESVGHHMVHHFVNQTLKNRGGSIHHVILNHYRSCTGLRHGVTGLGFPVLGQPTVKDMSIMNFRESVLRSPLIKQFLHILQYK